MNLTAFFALVRRDLRLFFRDRRAVVLSFAAPILIGSFFGYIFSGPSGGAAASRVDVDVIDEDHSAVSRSLVAALSADPSLEVSETTLEKARKAVRAGKVTVAAEIPQGFGDRSVQAFFRGEEKPEIRLMYDPSHGPELAMVRGVLTQHVMETVSAEAFGPNSRRYVDESLAQLDRARMPAEERKTLAQMLESLQKWYGRAQANPQAGRGAGHGLGVPFAIREESLAARKDEYNSYSHSFAGMSVQFILMMGMDAGLLLIMQRKSGIWKRLRAAPVSRYVILASRVASATLISFVILTVVFAFARAVFHVRIEGSLVGFAAIAAAFGLMTAAFGLLVAMSGKTVEATRGVAIMATLLMVMLGGAWVPAFVFPQWMQKATFAVPTRWAVDGLDAMTWRGLGFHAAIGPTAALLGFAVLFGGLALWRFRWEEDG